MSRIFARYAHDFVAVIIGEFVITTASLYEVKDYRPQAGGGFAPRGN